MDISDILAVKTNEPSIFLQEIKQKRLSLGSLYANQCHLDYFSMKIRQHKCLT